jgi:serine/threonine protein phosphatase PrpC
MRTLNEDSLLTIDVVRNQQSVSRPLAVFLVADGMGGHAAGEVASGTIVNQVAQRTLTDLVPANSGRTDRLPWLQDVVSSTNRKIYDMRQAAGTDMGSTLVMIVLDADQLYVAHVGDSRAYHINAAGITRLTIDHSLVQRLVSTGQITEEEARTHEQRNVIYRTMGDRAEVEVDTSVRALAAGDRLLLCSDGMSGQVEDSVIQQIVMAAPGPQAACDRLIEAANAAGGPDNITAVIVEVVAA